MDVVALAIAWGVGCYSFAPRETVGSKKGKLLPGRYKILVRVLDVMPLVALTVIDGRKMLLGEKKHTHGVNAKDRNCAALEKEDASRSPHDTAVGSLKEAWFCGK